MNKTIVNSLKKRLEGVKGNWVEEQSNVLWAYRTMPKRLTGKTPFSMTYGAKAVVPVEVSLLSSRITSFAQRRNDERMIKNLDGLEEHRDIVAVRLTDYQQRLAQGYNRKVKS
ncbi:uncharacterized protein LOC142624598 [Castanea sativa]|uniref:uncharacterized protein LOC142624598 n=1 Tax=Castanea sativa TaxID=21020 RepID=UPI003F64E03E